MEEKVKGKSKYVVLKTHELLALGGGIGAICGVAAYLAGCKFGIEKERISWIKVLRCIRMHFPEAYTAYKDALNGCIEIEEGLKK